MQRPGSPDPAEPDVLATSASRRRGAAGGARTDADTDTDADAVVQPPCAADAAPARAPGDRGPARDGRRGTSLVVAAGAVAATLTLFAVFGLLPGWSSPAAPGEPIGGTARAPEVADATVPDIVDDDGPFRLVAVSASGDRLVVTYTDGRNGAVTSEVPSGWSGIVPDEAGPRVNRFSVSTGADGGSGGGPDTVTCRVTREGALVVENTAVGESVSADCGRF